LQLPPTLAAFGPRSTVLLKLIGVQRRLMSAVRGVPFGDVIVAVGDLSDAFHQVRHKLRRRGLRTTDDRPSRAPEP
jgi:hypothetical protein